MPASGLACRHGLYPGGRRRWLSGKLPAGVLLRLTCCCCSHWLALQRQHCQLTPSVGVQTQQTLAGGYCHHTVACSSSSSSRSQAPEHTSTRLTAYRCQQLRAVQGAITRLQPHAECSSNTTMVCECEACCSCLPRKPTAVPLLVSPPAPTTMASSPSGRATLQSLPGVHDSKQRYTCQNKAGTCCELSAHAAALPSRLTNTCTIKG
jgi:hypothetical protein